MIGYKIMNMSQDFNVLISGANSSLKFKAKKGITLTMPNKGVFLSTNKQYVLDYYLNYEINALLTLEFNMKDIVFGNLTDKESEISVKKAIIRNIEIIKE